MGLRPRHSILKFTHVGGPNSPFRKKAPPLILNHMCYPCLLTCLRIWKPNIFCKFDFMKKCIFFIFSGHLTQIWGKYGKKINIFLLFLRDGKKRNLFSKHALKIVRRTLSVFTKKMFNPTPWNVLDLHQFDQFPPEGGEFLEGK